MTRITIDRGVTEISIYSKLLQSALTEGHNLCDGYGPVMNKHEKELHMWDRQCL